MKRFDYWEKVFTILAFLSALSSAIINYSTGKNYFWQLQVLLWIIIAFIKQKTIEETENKK